MGFSILCPNIKDNNSQIISYDMHSPVRVLSSVYEDCEAI